mmetsp:Transcript_52013/g.119671  ORF Transcript_52013/g.119671 Transcript_52013/m.119671 type:complete len:80 (+) Transcript_52013:940-1179(+)
MSVERNLRREPQPPTYRQHQSKNCNTHRCTNQVTPRNQIGVALSAAPPRPLDSTHTVSCAVAPLAKRLHQQTVIVDACA